MVLKKKTKNKKKKQTKKQKKKERLCKHFGFADFYPLEAIVDFSRQHCMIRKLLPVQVIKYL